MDDVTREALDDYMCAAMKSGDCPTMQKAIQTSLKAYSDCLQSQSNRTKRIEANVEEIKDLIVENRHNTNARFEAWENQARGAKKMIDVLKIAAGAGGGAMILKFLEHF